MTRVFYVSIIPAIAAATIAYFGYYAIWGSRGLLALSDTNAKLAVANEELASLEVRRERLDHRIKLLSPGHADPDLVEELARGQLLDSAPGEVVVPRNAH